MPDDMSQSLLKSRCGECGGRVRPGAKIHLSCLFAYNARHLAEYFGRTWADDSGQEFFTPGPAVRDLAERCKGRGIRFIPTLRLPDGL